MPCRRQVTEELPAAKALFTKASDILGYDLLDRATNGPKDQLDSTVGLLLTFVQCIQGRLIYSPWTVEPCPLAAMRPCRQVSHS